MRTQEERERWRLHWERLLTNIGEQLDGEWELKLSEEGYGHWGSLKNPQDQIYLSFSHDDHHKKIWIGTELPKDDKGNTPYVGLGMYEHTPKIGVGENKTADQIVSDIKRRLLPEYLPLLEQAKLRIVEANAYHNTVEDVARQIAEIVGVQIPKREGFGRNEREVRNKVSFYHSPHPIFHETHGEAEVHGDEVKLELRLGHDDAIALLKYLTSR
jgi:hypothetical protein